MHDSASNIIMLYTARVRDFSMLSADEMFSMATFLVCSLNRSSASCEGEETVRRSITRGSRKSMPQRNRVPHQKA